MKKPPAIGIIGGTGGMGRWFARFFRETGHEVYVTGRNAGLDLPSLAAICPVVIVSVPIGATVDTIVRVGPCLPADSVLMDFTSLKTEPVRAMLANTTAEVVGLHPLFGPDAASLAGQNVAVCPARGTRWLSWLREVLGGGGARLSEMAPEEHDALMAYVQGLTHIGTIVAGTVLREAGIAPERLRAVSTPLFRERMAAVEKVFHRHPRLYAELLARNPETLPVLARCEAALGRLKALLEDGDAEDLARFLSS